MIRWAVLGLATLAAAALFWLGIVITGNGGALGIALVIVAVLLFVVSFASSFPQATSLARDD